MDCCKDKRSILSTIKEGMLRKNSLKSEVPSENKKKLVLVGTPNVGKSVIFNKLTGSYVVVSNYPGTTVEVSRGTGNIYGEIYEVIDTPGMYSLLPITDEERVTRTLLLKEKPDIVGHVVDATNLERMLPLTLQLKEAGTPIILIVNMMDEAEKIGLSIDLKKLSLKLGIPVVGTAAALNRGIDELKRKVAEYEHHRAA